MLRKIAIAGAVLGAALAHSVGQAAAWSACTVSAPAGYSNCLSAVNPTVQGAQATTSAGTPYRFQLTRFSDGAKWGWWEWNSTEHRFVYLSLSGTITAQVDNLGSGNALYYVVLS